MIEGINGNEPGTWAIVTDSTGSTWFGRITCDKSVGEVRCVTLDPAYQYNSQLQPGPNGQIGTSRLILPVEMLYGVRRVECEARTIRYFENESERADIVRAAESVRTQIRATATGIQIAGATEMPRVKA